MGSILDFLFKRKNTDINKLDSNGRNGTTLEETVVCTPQWGRVYDWTINKTVTPTEIILTEGRSGRARYSITVQNDPLTGEEECVITGVVCISNKGEEDTEGLQSNLDIEYDTTMQNIVVPLDVSVMPVIKAGEKYCYFFTFTPPSFTPGGKYKITANTTITNHSGSDEPKGPHENCSGTYPKLPTTVYDTIKVKDTMFQNGEPKEFHASLDGEPQGYNYYLPYNCEDVGLHENTATIVETGQSSTATVIVTCTSEEETTTLEQELTLDGCYGGRYEWEIKKTVSKDVLDLFQGDSEKATYTVSVKNSEIIKDDKIIINGKICIKNTGENNTEDLACNLVLMEEGNLVPLESISVIAMGSKVLTPNEQYCYDYSFEVVAFTPGKKYSVILSSSITNYEGYNGEVHEISTGKEWTCPLSPTPTNSSITVKDTNQANDFTFNANNTLEYQDVSYDVSYSCENEGDNINTATIDGTDKKASTTVRVNCYSLKVSKTVQTTLNRKYSWTIEKACIDPTTKKVLKEVTVRGLTYATLHYVVSVTPTVDEKGGTVYGVITVENPNPSKSIEVTLSDDIVIGTNSYKGELKETNVVIPAGTTLTFEYSKVFDSIEIVRPSYNIATATYKTTEGRLVECKSEAMPIRFNSGQVTEIDPCVDVYDSYYGKLNSKPVCKKSKEFYYTRVVGPYNICCDCGREIENTASYVSDTTTFSVTNIVTICVV